MGIYMDDCGGCVGVAKKKPGESPGFFVRNDQYQWLATQKL